MNVGYTNPESVKMDKCCSKCGINKPLDRIVKNRNICKDCCNKKKREKIKENSKNVDINANKTCSRCNIVKNVTLFARDNSYNVCRECFNLKRRNNYKNNEELRSKACEYSSNYKQNQKAIRDELKELEKIDLENKIGQDNVICKYCNEVKHKDRFRHNRLKCRDCERDEPLEKFKRYVRTRIYNCLKGNKTKHAHDYLGCSPSDYLKWISYNTDEFTLDNYGSVWHIDHVIPLSKFNFQNEEEKLIAFNWRNTMPLSAKENLSKNCKILIPQVEQHYKLLVKYHNENNIELPQMFISLYAKYLEAGSSLEP